MRRLLFTFLPVLLMACGREPVAPATGVGLTLRATSQREEIVLPVEWVAYNACLDEDLRGSGTSFVGVHTVAKATDTRTNQQVRLADDWQMVGLTTGDVWLPEPGVHNSAVMSASGDFLTLEERFVFKNQTTGVVLDWPSKITFVTNANGEVKVERFQFDDCTLRH